MRYDRVSTCLQKQLTRRSPRIFAWRNSDATPRKNLSGAEDRVDSSRQTGPPIGQLEIEYRFKTGTVQTQDLAGRFAGLGNFGGGYWN